MSPIMLYKPAYRLLVTLTENVISPYENAVTGQDLLLTNTYLLNIGYMHTFPYHSVQYWKCPWRLFSLCIPLISHWTHAICTMPHQSQPYLRNRLKILGEGCWLCGATVHSSLVFSIAFCLLPSLVFLSSIVSVYFNSTHVSSEPLNQVFLSDHGFNVNPLVVMEKLLILPLEFIDVILKNLFFDLIFVEVSEC